MITTSLDEEVAGAFKQLVRILFPGDELVDVADSPKHEVEMFYPRLRLFALVFRCLQLSNTLA